MCAHVCIEHRCLAEANPLTMHPPVLPEAFLPQEVSLICPQLRCPLHAEVDRLRAPTSRELMLWGPRRATWLLPTVLLSLQTVPTLVPQQGVSGRGEEWGLSLPPALCRQRCYKTRQQQLGDWLFLLISLLGRGKDQWHRWAQVQVAAATSNALEGWSKKKA